MNHRSMKIRLLAGGFLAGVLAIVAVGAWYFFIRDDAPPPVSLEAAIQAASSGSPSSGSTPGTSPSTGSGGTTTNDGRPTGLAGTWNLVAGGQSFAGYRVQEELATIGATTAVGRTTALTGSLQFDGTQITAVEVTADLTRLTSDSSLRDGQLRNQGIETSRFPTATFRLTSPITVGQVPAEGETIKQTIKGELTLHGVTRAIEMQVEGVLKDGRVIVVGSTVIQFADYNITAPRAASVLSIDNKAIMELQLIFQRA